MSLKNKLRLRIIECAPNCTLWHYNREWTCWTFVWRYGKAPRPFGLRIFDNGILGNIPLINYVILSGGKRPVLPCGFRP